jgi:hypothetical protein
MSNSSEPTISALPTSDQYSSSDNASSSLGSDSRLAGAPPACPLTSNVPCDIDELVLVEIAGSRTTKYHVEHGEFIPEPPVPKRGIRLFDFNADWPKHPTLQVIGDRPGATAPTKIMASVSSFATCGPSHVAVSMVAPEGRSGVQKISPAGVEDVFSFEVARHESDNGAIAFFQRYITWGIDPVPYIVSASTCGNRPGGKPNTGGMLTVEVFPADQYQLSVSIPARGRLSYERARTYNPAANSDDLDVTDSSKLEGNLGALSFERSDELSSDKGLTLKDEIKYKSQDVTFNFKHNGQSGDDVSANISKILKMLEDAKIAIEEIKDFIRDWVPQAGFKFEFGLSFLSGTITLAWGYKENKDWRVYYGLSGKFLLKVFEIDLTLSFGIKVPALLVRVEGTVGGSAELSSEFRFNSPDTLIAIEEHAKIDIPAKIQGRAEAGYGWASVSVAMGVKSGFEGDACLKSESNTCKLTLEVKWVGIVGFVEHHDSPNDGDQTDEYILIDEKEIWKKDIDL